MFDRLIVLLTNTSLVLENIFVYLLKGLQELTVFFAESFETLDSFINIFGFSMLQLLFQSSKIFIIFSPGILSAWIGYYHSVFMLIIGVVYILLLIFAAFGFKTVATENGIMSGNMPNQWLWYFPYSWVNVEFIREKLSNILQLHNRLRTLSAEFNKNGNIPFKDDILKIAKNSSFKLIIVRRNLFKIIRRTQIKYGIKSNFNLVGYGILSSNENYNSELRSNIHEYIDPFEKQYSKLVENLENLYNKLQDLIQSENNLNESEKESFHTEIENIELLLEALDSINEDSI